MRWKTIAAMALALAGGVSSQAQEAGEARREQALLASAWNRLVPEVRAAQARFTPDENTALDAILQQIQEGWIALGLVPERQTETRNAGHSVMQLGPNTLALQRYFERKYRENARVVAFRRLSIDARKLAEAAANLAPTVSVGQARKGSAAQF